LPGGIFYLLIRQAISQPLIPGFLREVDHAPPRAIGSIILMSLGRLSIACSKTRQNHRMISMDQYTISTKKGTARRPSLEKVPASRRFTSRCASTFFRRAQFIVGVRLGWG